MSDEFLDNQVVTAADLNNIAIDLGYADYSHFPETPPLSAVSALNQITSDLVSKGVLILGNKCNVTASGGAAYIDTGVIVFDSGAKKRIEAVQSLNLTAGSINYIYALNDTVNNTIDLVCSTEEPSTGDFVMMAEVSADGKVTMKRSFAKAKTAPPAAQQYKYIESVSLSKGNSKTIDVGFDNFSFLSLSYNFNNALDKVPHIIENMQENLVYEIRNSKVEVVRSANTVTIKYNSTDGYNTCYINNILIA